MGSTTSSLKEIGNLEIEDLHDDPGKPKEKRGPDDIESPVVARLLRKARRVVEHIAWKNGLVWYPTELSRRIPVRDLTDFVLPDYGTAARRTCVQAIRDHTGEPYDDGEAWAWLSDEIRSRLYRFIVDVRNNLDKVRLVVTEDEIQVRAERSRENRPTVGTASWSAPVGTAPWSTSI